MISFELQVDQSFTVRGAMADDEKSTAVHARSLMSAFLKYKMLAVRYSFVIYNTGGSWSAATKQGISCLSTRNSSVHSVVFVPGGGGTLL